MIREKTKQKGKVGGSSRASDFRILMRKACLRNVGVTSHKVVVEWYSVWGGGRRCACYWLEIELVHASNLKPW